MMKTLPVFSTLMSVVVFALDAYATEPARIVIQHKEPTEASGMLYAQSFSRAQERCIPTPDFQGEWCLPALQAGHKLRAQASSQMATVQPQYSLVELDLQGWSLQHAIDSIKKTGWFASVEADIIFQSDQSAPLSAPLSWNENDFPNDPFFNEQTFYFGDEPEVRFGQVKRSNHGIQAAWALITQPKRTIDVIVMDAGFYPHEDLEYYSGASFVTTGDAKRSELFFEDEYNEYCNPHGLGVASVIAATINNEQGMTGIVNDVRLHALRVMNCSRGSLFDVSDALRWLAGAPAFFDDNLSFPYQGQPGVINLSLGATYINENNFCPEYLQDAINKVVAAGFVVVAAAGNNNENAENFVPAACDHVLSVGALTVNSSKASFSNYGAIDVMALGSEVVGLCTSSEVCFWAGTSFASPIVAGIVALGMKDIDLDWQPEWFRTAAIAASRPLVDEDGRCAMKGCGYGMIHAADFIQSLRAAEAGALSQIVPALKAFTPCEQSWYIEHFGNKVAFCDLVRLQFHGGTAPIGRYVLYARSVGQSNLHVVAEFADGDVVLPRNVLDFDSTVYFFRDCPQGGADCTTSLYPLSAYGHNQGIFACD
ncbi:S8 family serine peptidase [Alkalimonas sp. MEB108]|uniref:S8 family serine peptidase n=1 Tax=Alkalimonas cellulosilytica TaxID=3058395 RepID=A0ABU7JA95_9GAMM|nr:S8 family serine peptidase [Alkalimonas sp. MEB108]MEE2003257.1 S8 family serine peptidase [Alkalimonas sp. MEB108]